MFKCMKCGYLYRNREDAEDCEAWCKKHKSCNMEITKKAIAMNLKGGMSK